VIYLIIAYTGPQTPGWIGIDPSWEDRLGQSLSQTQIPLTLAWAITNPKSQGLTLN
jgi:hypothetical protein